MNKNKEKSNPTHGIRVKSEDYYTVSRWLKSANRTFAWLFSVLASEIRQNQSINLTKLFGLAKKREGHAVNVWKEDENYKPMKETFDFLSEDDESNPEKWWFK